MFESIVLVPFYVKMSHTRATQAQLNALATFVAEDKYIEHNKFSAVFTRKHLQQKWEDIAEKLNNMTGAKKTGALWRKTYFDMRSRAKVKRAEDRKNLTGTGGGPFKKNIYSPAEETALSNMGEVVIEGHHDVRESVVLMEEEVSYTDGLKKDQNRAQSKAGCSWMIDSPEETTNTEDVEVTPNTSLATNTESLEATPNRSLATKRKAVEATPNRSLATNTEAVAATSNRSLEANTEATEATPNRLLQSKKKLSTSIAQSEKFNRLQAEQNEEMKNFHMALLDIKKKNEILIEKNALIKDQNSILMKIAEALSQSEK